ncbi:MAG: nucleoside triphosphate pyrophosphohydrolase [Chloroflexi bacterium]|nr:nucleoside triphosphate pyrophosphohydrolase [Chloroflexota bacterium]
MSYKGDLDQFATLVAIVAKLRAPDGCPWDREQTHRSLRENLLEECYEVLEALDEGSPPQLCEELGDLLMQVMLHAQIARDTSEFTINDVIRSISSKLVHRHPHVFGNAKAETSAEVLHNWEALKRQERGTEVSLLAGIPKHLPALSRSQEMQGRVARVGFDWADLDGVIDKLAEEVNELRHAETPDQKEAEFGDLLFTMANIARRMGIDGESALREASQRFYQRWTVMEALCRELGIDIGEQSLDKQNDLWEEAKRRMGEKP